MSKTVVEMPDFKKKPSLMDMAQMPFKVKRQLTEANKAWYCALMEDDLDGYQGHVISVEEDMSNRKWFVIPRHGVTEVELWYDPKNDTSWPTKESAYDIAYKDVNDMEYEWVNK